MKCPVCENALTEKTVESITVDVCEGGCGGIWFDNFELEKVDTATESAGEGLLEVAHDEAITVDHTARRKCPKCGDQIMMRHFASTRREVEVDECPACGGIWLDAGELGHIRDQYATDDEQQEAFDKYFDSVFGEELTRMRAESEEKALKAQRFARMFRFICPSYYVPGRQLWGAF
jgi:Zn-finger nucleic acid-binding protein